MAQQVKVPVAKPEDQGSVPGPTSGTSVCTNSLFCSLCFLMLNPP